MVVLYILLGLIAAIVLLFCVKITIQLEYDESFDLFIKVLFIKIRLLPAKPKKKKPPKEEPPPEEPPPEEPKSESEAKPKGENFVMRFYHEQGFSGVVKFLRDILAALNTMLGDIIKRSFVVEKLFLDMRIAKEDAAQTAIAYGKTCSAVFPTLGYLCSVLQVRQYNANIYPDYLANKSTASIVFWISVRPIRLTNAVVRFAFRALWAFIKAKKYASDKKKQQPVTIERNVDK